MTPGDSMYLHVSQPVYAMTDTKAGECSFILQIIKLLHQPESRYTIRTSIILPLVECTDIATLFGHPGPQSGPWGHGALRSPGPWGSRDPGDCGDPDTPGTRTDFLCRYIS